MDLGNTPLEFKNMLQSNPLKSRFLVRGLAVLGRLLLCLPLPVTIAETAIVISCFLNHDNRHSSPSSVSEIRALSSRTCHTTHLRTFAFLAGAWPEASNSAPRRSVRNTSDLDSLGIRHRVRISTRLRLSLLLSLALLALTPLAAIHLINTPPTLVKLWMFRIIIQLAN